MALPSADLQSRWEQEPREHTWQDMATSAGMQYAASLCCSQKGDHCSATKLASQPQALS